MADEQVVTPPADGPWYKGADDTVVGYLQQRGIADKPPAEVLKNLMEAHTSAEKLIGAPANELVRWPKDSNDAAGWQSVRTRLGVPTDAKEYDFSSIKFADNSELDPGFQEFLRSTAYELSIPKEAAGQLAGKFTAFLEKQETDDNAGRMAKIAAESEALKKVWGPNYETNKLAAENMARSMLVKSGMKLEDAANAVNALEQQIGGAKTMEMFRAFSRMASEDTFVDPSGGGGGSPNVMSYQEAVATKAALMRDNAFVQKWNDGDVKAGQQLQALDTIIVNSQPLDEEAEFRRQVAAQYRG